MTEVNTETKVSVKNLSQKIKENQSTKSNNSNENVSIFKDSNNTQNIENENKTNNEELTPFEQYAKELDEQGITGWNKFTKMFQYINEEFDKADGLDALQAARNARKEAYNKAEQENKDFKNSDTYKALKEKYEQMNNSKGTDEALLDDETRERINQEIEAFEKAMNEEIEKAEVKYR